MKSGRECDNCERYLPESAFDKYGSWSYTCPKCDYRYVHGGVNKVLDKFR